MLAALLVVLSGLVAIGGPAAAAPPAPATLDEVYAALGVDRIPADYVVMVDVSGSMQQGGRYAAVKDSLRTFFAALAPDDQLTLGAFADSVQIVHQGPAGRSPDKLVDLLPATATGAKTDIGAAIETTVNQLRRKDAPGIATVVLLSDGEQDPPRGSAYPFDSGYAWDQLTSAVSHLRKTSLQAYAVPLAGATGARLLGKAFPNTQVLNLSSIDQLTSRLEQPKAAARAAKARSVLGDDPVRPVQVEWVGLRAIGAGRTVLTVRFRSATRHLPLTVTDISVRTGDSALHATARSKSVELPPGGTATVNVVVDWDAGPLRIAPLSTVARSVSMTLQAEVRSRWSSVLATNLSTTLDARLAGAQVDANLSAQRGSIWWWLFGALVLAVVLLGLARLRHRRLRPNLLGTLRTVLPDGSVRRLPLNGQAMQINQATMGLRGYGDVRMSRPTVRSTVLVLAIAYSPDGSVGGRETKLCEPGETATVSGVEFAWELAPATPPRPRSTAAGAAGSRS